MNYEADDLSTLWAGMMAYMWNGQPDHITPSGATWYDCVCRTPSMAYEVNLSFFGFDQQRWTKLVRQYLDVSHTLQFLDRAEQIAMGEVKSDAVAGVNTKVSII